MNPDEQLRSIVKWRPAAKPDRLAGLGDVVKEIMDNRITPLQKRFESVASVWDQLLPDELQQHCKIVDISGGELKVKVDSPAYLYELRMCSSELLTELRRQCRRVRIGTIKFVLGQ